MVFPDGKQFAFSIIDDTDGATVGNVRPIYELLTACGMRTTKTVWPVSCPEGSEHFGQSQTLEDLDYRQFVLDLQARGFEIAFHGATMESSPRERTQRALELFCETFGSYPRLHVNHSTNLENLYWGAGRIDEPLVRLLYKTLGRDWKVKFQGHIERSEYFWGDACEQRIDYVRNLTFNRMNLLRVNPSMPYSDDKRPFVRWWFSSADADDCSAFNHLLRESEQERLQRDGGVCIVSTHFAKGFVQDGRVQPRTRELLHALSQRPGWFTTAAELLDWLRARRASMKLPANEWRSMQWTWLREAALRHARRLLA